MSSKFLFNSTFSFSLSASKIESNPGWKLNHVKRSDVKQADIAPLMSTLLGIGIPKNSVGKIPQDYLKLAPDEKVEASLTVAKQMFEMLQSARLQFDKYFHTPYSGLSTSEFEVKLGKISRLRKFGKHELAIKSADELFDLSLQGVEYYNRYHRSSLYMLITISYLGFLLLTSLNVAKNFTPVLKLAKSKSMLVNVISIMILMVATAVFLNQNAPWHYVIYYWTPVFVWRKLVLEMASFQLPTTVKQDSASLVMSTIGAFLT